MQRRRPRLLPLVVLATHLGVGCASVEPASKSPNADALCPDPRGEQRVPYRNATLCVSNHFAELLECLETNQLEEVANGAKERVSGSAEGGTHQAWPRARRAPLAASRRSTALARSRASSRSVSGSMSGATPPHPSLLRGHARARRPRARRRRRIRAARGRRPRLSNASTPASTPARDLRLPTNSV